MGKTRWRACAAALGALVALPLSTLTPTSAAGATVEPHDCEIHNNLTETIVEKHYTFPDPSNPPQNSRLQVGHEVYFKAELRDRQGNWVATSKGHSHVPYRDDNVDVILQNAQETITLRDGVIRTSGVYSVTPNNYNEWNSIPAVGISGRYKGMIGARTFQITALGASLNASLYLCKGLEENWRWTPPGNPPEIPPTNTDLVVPTVGTGSPQGTPDSPVKPNRCFTLTGLREELTEKYGAAPGEGGTWPPGVGSHVYYRSIFRDADGDPVVNAQGYSYTPYQDGADDVSLKFTQQLFRLKDGVIKTTGVYNLTANSVHEWHGMYAEGVSGVYKGMRGARLFRVTEPNFLDGAIYLCKNLKENWKWNPPEKSPGAV